MIVNSIKKLYNLINNNHYSVNGEFNNNQASVDLSGHLIILLEDNTKIVIDKILEENERDGYVKAYSSKNGVVYIIQFFQGASLTKLTF